MLRNLLLLALQLQCSSGKRVNTKMVEFHLENLADGALSRSATDNATMNEYVERFRSTFSNAQQTPLLIAEKINEKLFMKKMNLILGDYQDGWDTSFANSWREVAGSLADAADAVGEYYAALWENRGKYGGRLLKQNETGWPEKYESCTAAIDQSAYLKVLDIFGRSIKWQQNGVNTETISLSLQKYLEKKEKNACKEYLDTLESHFTKELGASFVLGGSSSNWPHNAENDCNGRFIMLWAEVFRAKTITFSKDLSSVQQAITFENDWWLASEKPVLDGCNFVWGCGRISGGKARKKGDDGGTCKCDKNSILGDGCPSGEDFGPGRRYYSRTATIRFTNAEVAVCRCEENE